MADQAEKIDPGISVSISDAATSNGAADGAALHDGVPSTPPLAAVPASAAEQALNSPALYLNRELTWLSFNERVLHEAEDESNALLERVKFLAINASTIDE